MEELTIETPDTESTGDGMDVLPEATDLDTESALPESKEDSDENDVEDAEFFEDEESNIDEDAESDANEDSESVSVTGEVTGSSETYPEKPNRPVSSPETVSGNSTDNLIGNGADASTHAAYESDGIDSILLVETLERQNDILYAGFMSTLFILGTILGVLIIHGFRLRRV
ncbi:MAG: hypothetical protein HDR03_12600 [Lachnospiraceae bacterium]|nr:hypothetical protein [Lachnospiraceae bacterium]